MSNKKKSAVPTVEEPKFTKEKLVNSKRFRNECDIVSAVLMDGVEYTIPEVENKITEYMKGKVK